MNIMTPGVAPTSVAIGDIAENAAAACISSRVRQLSRIITRVYAVSYTHLTLPTILLV